MQSISYSLVQLLYRLRLFLIFWIVAAYSASPATGEKHIIENELRQFLVRVADLYRATELRTVDDIADALRVQLVFVRALPSREQWEARIYRVPDSFSPLLTFSDDITQISVQMPASIGTRPLIDLHFVMEPTRLKELGATAAEAIVFDIFGEAAREVIIPLQLPGTVAPPMWSLNYNPADASKRKLSFMLSGAGLQSVSFTQGR